MYVLCMEAFLYRAIKSIEIVRKIYITFHAYMKKNICIYYDVNVNEVMNLCRILESLEIHEFIIH